MVRIRTPMSELSVDGPRVLTTAGILEFQTQ